MTTKIHLFSPFLGSNCYIGSKLSPIILRLSTGTTNPSPPNKPIRGIAPRLESNQEGTIIQLTRMKLVDNAFSVPVASGCGTSPTNGALLDSSIDHKLGLPSAVGHNTAIIEAVAEQAGEILKSMANSVVRGVARFRQVGPGQVRARSTGNSVESEERSELMRSHVSMRRFVVYVMVVASGSLGVVGSAFAALPDGRGYELVSPVEKNGVSPYAAVPSLSGEAVEFQARGAFAGATSGSLNLYQAARSSGGWQTVPLTPTPSSPLGALEEQVPVFFSSDLAQTIFTTPESYAAGDSDGGALDLYPAPLVVR